jgi:hypothetical protein
MDTMGILGFVLFWFLGESVWGIIRSKNHKLFHSFDLLVALYGVILWWTSIR